MTQADPKRAEDAQVIPDFVIESMARCLLPEVQAYFASPQGQAAFSAWKEKQKRENT